MMLYRMINISRLLLTEGTKILPAFSQYDIALNGSNLEGWFGQGADKGLHGRKVSWQIKDHSE